MGAGPFIVGSLGWRPRTIAAASEQVDPRPTSVPTSWTRQRQAISRQPDRERDGRQAAEAPGRIERRIAGRRCVGRRADRRRRDQGVAPRRRASEYHAQRLRIHAAVALMYLGAGSGSPLTDQIA